MSMDNENTVAMGRAFRRGFAALSGVPAWKLHASGVVASLLTVQLLFVSFAAVKTVGEIALRQGAVHIDLVPGTLDQRIQELHVALRAIPSVKDVRYVPREQAFVDEKSRDASIGEFLEQYDLLNPFPDTFVVTPGNTRAFDDLRAFVESPDVADGVDPASLVDIAAKEAETIRLFAAVDTIEMGILLLLALGVFGAGLLSFNVLVHVAAARRSAASVEVLAGAVPSVVAAPTIAAGAWITIGCLVVATLLTGIVIVLLGLFPASAAVGSWLASGVLVGWWPIFPLILVIEGISMFALSAVVGRVGSTFRS
jgi:cell division transport system permease protein